LKFKKKPFVSGQMVDKIRFGFTYLLYPEVGESLVGFSHTMGIFFFLKSRAFTF